MVKAVCLLFHLLYSFFAVNLVGGGFLNIRCRGNIWAIKNYLAARKSKFMQQAFVAYYERRIQKQASWIGYTSQFANKPCFPHGLSGIFVSGDAVVGKDCVIFQQVTIGSNTLSSSLKKGSPVIGDHVYIGAGAKIIGKIRIGDNCRIGANAVVYADMPDNSVAVQSPTRIIQKNHALDNRFYSKQNGKLFYYRDGKMIPE